MHKATFTNGTESFTADTREEAKAEAEIRSPWPIYWNEDVFNGPNGRDCIDGYDSHDDMIANAEGANPHLAVVLIEDSD